MLIDAYVALDDSFHWLDILNPTKKELDFITQKYNLPPIVVQDCMDRTHLPKYEPLTDKQFLILRVYDEKSKKTASTVQGLTHKISIFIGKNYLITLHRTEQPFIMETRENWIKDPKNTEGNILANLLGQLIYGVFSSFQLANVLCQKKLDEFEALLHRAETTTSSIKQKYLIKRKVYIYRQMLKQSLTILNKLKVDWEFNPSLLSDIKEFGENQYFIAEEMLEHINNLMNLHLALASHNTNKIIRVLTIFSVFFSPLTFIVGVYGMNFQNMPELHYKYGYPMVLLFMLTVCIILFMWFRKKGWLK